MQQDPTIGTESQLGVGDPVEVHTKFDGSWSPGFEVAAVRETGYLLRRSHDGQLLPEPTSPDDLRPRSVPTP
jgi:hypothetical protein